jgi:hypothetical protein
VIKYKINFSIFCYCRDRGWDEEQLAEMLASLQQRGVVASIPDQPGTFTRAAHPDTDVQVSNNIIKLPFI